MPLRKIRRYKIVLAGAILALATSPTSLAQSSNSTDSSQKTFHLDDAVSYALAHYPTVRAALSQARAAQAGVSLARTAYLPQANGLWQMNRGTRNNVFGQLLPQSVIAPISGPVLPNASDANVWDDAAGLLVSWEPFDFGYRRAMVNAARFDAAASDAQVKVTRLDVARATAETFLGVLAAKQVAKSAQADVDRRDVFAKSVNALVQSELRPGADASRAAADLAQARIRLIQAQTAERVRRAAFADLLGLPSAGIEIVPGSLLDTAPQGSLAPGDPVTNPLAVAQRTRVDQSQARDQALARSYYPRFSLQSAISARGSGAEVNGNTLGGTNGLEFQRMNWIAGVQMTFPILQIFSIHEQRRVQQANEDAEKARYDQTVQDLSSQIEQARINLDGSRQIAENTSIALSSARDSEQQARARYQAGLATSIEVSEAESQLAQAEMDDAVARLTVWHDLAEVAAAQGDLQPFLELVQGAGH